jgi:hypothetical protein
VPLFALIKSVSLDVLQTGGADAKIPDGLSSGVHDNAGPVASDPIR